MRYEKYDFSDPLCLEEVQNSIGIADIDDKCPNTTRQNPDDRVTLPDVQKADAKRIGHGSVSW